METTTSSPSGITILVAPAVHAPLAHGCRPLHDEPAGKDGGGEAHGGCGNGGGGDGGDGGGGDGWVGATLSSPSTSSSACPLEHTSSVDVATSSPGGTTALVKPTGHVPPAQGCNVINTGSAGGGLAG